MEITAMFSFISVMVDFTSSGMSAKLWFNSFMLDPLFFFFHMHNEKHIMDLSIHYRHFKCYIPESRGLIQL